MITFDVESKNAIQISKTENVESSNMNEKTHC